MNRNDRRHFAARRAMATFALATALTGAAFAQASNKVNTANWKLANMFTSESLRPFTYSTNLTPSFINNTDVFWYSWRDDKGTKFWRIDPRAKKREPLFDSDHMAALLSELSKKPYDAQTLPITTVTFDEKDANLMRFTVDQNRYEYDISKKTLKILPRTAPATGTPPAGGQGGGGGRGGGNRGGGGGQGGPPGQTPPTGFKNESPDKKSYVYALDHNLYYVDVVDGKDSAPIQLTKDGVEDYSFGSRDTQNQFFQQQQQQQQQEQGTQTTGTGTQTPPERRVRAQVTWSKDSKRFFVTRSDQRQIKDLWLVNNLAQPRPTLMTYEYAMPGEPGATLMEMWVFNREKKELTKPAVDKYTEQRISNIHFQDDTSDKLRFARRDRLQRNYDFCELDLVKNETTVLINESVENAFLETQNVRYVKPGGDFIWFSERSGWGHYYLYSNDGKLKNQITSGPWRAFAISEVDADKNTMWFQADGREPNENPYYRHLYSVKLDGSNLQLLDAGNADHGSVLSPKQDFIVDVFSRTDMPPRSVVRDRSGKVILELETTDISRLLEVGWRMPETFQVKAADGVTDIYGNMWKPTDFDPKKVYPIIANVYPGPQTESVSAGFSATATNQRLAQLGFIVIQIGNRGGNPARSNAYHSYGYYNLRDYGLADKKAGIEELARKYPWIDIDRVGIYGHSGGGFMTAAALLLPPYNDFFKVGVSSAGNHDNNVYNWNWSEQHHGMKEVDVLDKDGKPTGKKKFEIKVPTTVELAANLKNKLLLVHGDMDNNVHPANTIRLVDALIKANKRFDFMLMPGQAHGFGPMQGYFTDMLMEYFAEHLLGDNYRRSADMTVKK